MYNRADLALFPLPLEAGLDQVIDLTASFLDGGTAILVQKGTAQPSPFGFFGPFSWQVRPLQPGPGCAMDLCALLASCTGHSSCGCTAGIGGRACRLSCHMHTQVWLALLAAVIGTTVAYHALNYSSPFGEFDTMRLRRAAQAPNEVKTFVVQSRAPLLSTGPGSSAVLVQQQRPLPQRPCICVQPVQAEGTQRSQALPAASTAEG